MSLSSRAQKVLAAILLLPEGKDGWRRATYRDQLHESVPGLSRGAVARAFKARELDGLVEVEGVGCSARVAQGYRFVGDGERLAREAGSIRPDPVSRSSTDPVFGSSLPLESSEDKEKPEPTTDRTDPAPIRLSDPVPATRLSFDDRSLSVFYAAATQTPLCGCMRPMHAKPQRKTGYWFWACMFGRKGCGMTLTMRYQPKAKNTEHRDQGQRAPDMSQVSLAVLRASKGLPETGASGVGRKGTG